jgi:hypothetical protein
MINSPHWRAFFMCNYINFSKWKEYKVYEAPNAKHQMPKRGKQRALVYWLLVAGFGRRLTELTENTECAEKVG